MTFNRRTAHPRHALNAFEINSFHLNRGGFRFALARLNRRALEDVPEVFYAAGMDEDDFPCTMPLWYSLLDSTDDYIIAILGSEPVIGIHHEQKLMRWSVDRLVVSEHGFDADGADEWTVAEIPVADGEDK